MRGSRWEGKAKTGTQHGNDLPGASIQVGYICHFSTYLLIPLALFPKTSLGTEGRGGGTAI